MSRQGSGFDALEQLLARHRGGAQTSGELRAALARQLESLLTRPARPLDSSDAAAVRRAHAAMCDVVERCLRTDGTTARTHFARNAAPEPTITATSP